MPHKSRSRSRSHKKHKKHKDHKEGDSRDRRHETGPISRKSKFSDGPPPLQGNADIAKLLQQQGKISELISQIDKSTNPHSEQTQQDIAKAQEMIKQCLSQNTSIQIKEQNLTINNLININRSILTKAGIEFDENIVQPKSTGINPYNQTYPNLSLAGLTSSNILNTLNDASKIKRKIYVPPNSNFNFIGLIIGPKGQNQKKLEEQTGCKILVRGKGSQKEGQPPQPDDNEDLHVLVVGENEMQTSKACAQIERILFADDETRNRLREDQLKMVALIKNEQTRSNEMALIDPSLTTPYGPPSEDAYIIPVPKDCVGLVIGKGGETIRNLQERSGARRVQVAMENTIGSDNRNVFVEGSPEAVEQVKKMLEEIVSNQRKMKATQDKNNRVEVHVPNNMIGLVIGKGGDTIKGINGRTGAFVSISREPEHQDLRDHKVLLVTGSYEAIEEAKKEIAALVEGGIRNLQHKGQLLAQQQAMIAINQGVVQGYGETGHTTSQYLMEREEQNYLNELQNANSTSINPMMTYSWYMSCGAKEPEIEEIVQGNNQVYNNGQQQGQDGNRDRRRRRR